MDWTWYLFSFEGRINRAKLWLALLVIICWMIFLGALTVIVGSFFGGPIVQLRVSDIFSFSIRRRIVPCRDRSLPLFVKLIATPLFALIYFATSIKRLHDRDKSGWWVVPFFVIPGLYNEFADRFDLSYAALPLGLAGFALCIWGFVEMYCLKGSRKTNRSGPTRCSRSIRRPRWEQNREIEMVPHKAGPPPVWHVKRGA